MKLSYRIFIAGIFFVGLFYTASYAQTDTSFDREKMVTYLQKLAESHKVMGSVAIDSAGQDVFNYSMGGQTVITGFPCSR